MRVVHTWTIANNEMPRHADPDDKPAATASIPNGAPVSSNSILPICNEIAGKVNAFLDSEAETPLLKRVQEQTRVALGVISTALERYR